MENSALIEIIQRHFDSVRDKKIDQIINLYANSDDLFVFVEGPRWQTLGYANVARGWRDFVDSEIVVKSCGWVENPHVKAVGKMGFVAGITELQVEVKGETKAIKMRGTFVLEEESEGNWKVVHEHFSQPAADPYGIGDWLKKD